jgi:DNA helicase-2/ATP-dependent DNA helicase PcrA
VTLPLPGGALERGRINAMADRMGLRISLDEQFAFLEADESLHLQAAPGSGKTTLVALKLALLAQDWTSRTQGICVLSHTNTATEEIMARLSGTAGQRLLRHPHFIGTIQSFVHTFAALPALRSAGITPQAIDNEAHAAHAARLLKLRKFSTLRNYLQRRTNGLNTVTEAEYVFDAAEPRLQIRDTPCKRTARSYRQLLELKGMLTRDGVLRYKDMYAIADQQFHRNPRLIAGLRHRFPFVLIDEMQDTDPDQAALLEKIFGDSVIVQCVGDINQHIYAGPGEGGQRGAFPAADALELPVSQRFGSAIAEVATRLAVNRPQTIRGNGPDGTLAVITFTEDSISRVVPSFEELVREHVPSEVVDAYAPRVLGSRANPGASTLFPRAISCYLPELTPAESATTDESLLHAYRKARSVMRSEERLGGAANLLWDAMRRGVWRNHGSVLLAPFADQDRAVNTPGHRVRILIAQALTRGCDDAEEWGLFARSLVAAVEKLADRPLERSRELRDGLASHSLLREAARTDRLAIASTTQNAKGETHCATLVLECAMPQGRAHDLAAVLPVIAGTAPLSRLSKSARQAALTTFVAATRPAHLLALAVHRDRAEPHLQALRNSGWLILEA